MMAHRKNIWIALGLAVFGVVGVGVPTAGAQGAKVARPSPNPDQANQLFLAGSKAYAAGDLKTAHEDFARLAALLPKVAAAHSALGAVLLEQGDLKGAIVELTTALRLQPGDARTMVNLGTAYSRAGDAERSVMEFRSLPQEALQSMGASDALAFATALVSVGDAASAQAVLEHSVANAPGNALLLDALGTVEAQEKQYGPAAENFKLAVAADPRLPSAHEHLGALLLTEGNASEALPELETAMQLGDTNLPVKIETGRALLATGHEQEAIPILREAVAASSTPSAAIANSSGAIDAEYALALALQSTGSLKEATELLAQVVHERPSDTAALTNYGLALVQTGDAKGALLAYNKALAAGDNSATLREDAGAAYLQQNDIDQALEQFQAGLAVEPNDAQLHYDLGLAFKLKDNLASAVPEFERAEALDPQLPDPPYTLGVVFMQQGRFADAERELNRAVTLRPDNGDAWSLLGSVYKEDGKPAEAIHALRQAIALLPEQPSPHVVLAGLLAQSGDPAGAAAERRTAADLSRAAISRQRANFALKSGRELLARGQVAEALVQLQTAVTADPGYAEAHLALAEALAKQGRNSEALAERQKAQGLMPAKTP